MAKFTKIRYKYVPTFLELFAEEDGGLAVLLPCHAGGQVALTSPVLVALRRRAVTRVKVPDAGGVATGHA